jgi:hypothetical protein
MKIKNLLILTVVLIHSIPFSSCKKEKEEDELKLCEINKTGTISFNLSGRVGLDPIDVFVNGEFVDS